MSKLKKPKKDKNAGFVRGHGYNSLTTGNYYTFLGVDKSGRFHFYRPFSQRWIRLTALELKTNRFFDTNQGKADNDFGKNGEDKFDLEQYTSSLSV